MGYTGGLDTGIHSSIQIYMSEFLIALFVPGSEALKAKNLPDYQGTNKVVFCSDNLQTLSNALKKIRQNKSRMLCLIITNLNISDGTDVYH